MTNSDRDIQGSHTIEYRMVMHGHACNIVKNTTHMSRLKRFINLKYKSVDSNIKQALQNTYNKTYIKA